MKHYYAKKVAAGTCAMVLAVSLSQPLVAEELDTEIPSAGATVAIGEYIANAGSAEDLSSFLPEESSVAATTTNTKTTKTKTAKKSTEDTLFEDIAIAKVNGGEEGYVNVRKKASTESKIVGKIYNNCGARILKTTSDGWYKIVSGNCTGYIKAEYFVTGNDAKDIALDNGYVFATITGSGVHVREKNSTDSSVITNVYYNEPYVVKKFDKSGEWVKLKIEAGVSGWVSSEFVKLSINMDTAITIKEEKEQIRKQKEAEEAARRAAEEEEAANQQSDDTDTGSSSSYSQSSGTSSSSSSSGSSSSYSQSSGSSSSSTSSSSSSGGGAAVVAYAKQFLGNPYVYGGSSLTNGTDCSGFTMSVYAHFGYSLNRSSYTQVYNGTAVSMDNLQPGDLLFYKYGGSTISHVAIYIGGGQIIHASTENTGIIIGGMGSPCAARRIIG